MKNYLLIPVILFYTVSGSHAQPQTFNYTGAVQTYTVGACVYSITVDVKGAGGAAVSTSYSAGGKGGRVQATIPVTQGQVLNIYVGQQALSAAGGWNGGGNGGSLAGGGAGGGGGSSDIRQGGTALSNRVIVAGGGGGGGYDHAHVYVNTGGQGGGTTGSDGVSNSGQTLANRGRGGTQTAGGAGGTGSNGNGNPGTLGIGGNADATYGGGGGAGYYGGGGGTQSDFFAFGGGGGGGSSYTIPSATGVTHTQGFQTGNGQIIITPAAASGPAAPGAITGASTVCAGSSEPYSISTVPTATSYSWTIPASATIAGQGTPSVTVTFGTTSGNISVTASNSCGTSTASTKAITVNANPTANAGSDTVICSGDSAILTAGGGAIYLWSTGETDAVIVVSPVSGTTYSVTVTNAGGCSDSDSVMVTVNPALATSVTTNPATCGNNDGSASVTPSGGTGTYTFLWSNGNTTSTVTGLTGQPTDTLIVIITDANGCTLTDTAIVECVTGIAHLPGSLSIRVFPNPSNGTFTIISEKLIIENVEIYNVMGEKVYGLKEVSPMNLPDRQTGDEPLTINLSSHQVGIYFFKVYSENGMAIYKIIKQ